MQRKCFVCYRSFEYDSSKGHTKNCCNGCIKKKRLNDKMEMVIIIKGVQCAQCPCDHIKALQLVDMDMKPIKSLDQAQNAIVLCCNCVKILA